MTLIFKSNAQFKTILILKYKYLSKMFTSAYVLSFSTMSSDIMFYYTLIPRYPNVLITKLHKAGFSVWGVVSDVSLSRQTHYTSDFDDETA